MKIEHIHFRKILISFFSLFNLLIICYIFFLLFLHMRLWVPLQCACVHMNDKNWNWKIKTSKIWLIFKCIRCLNIFVSFIFFRIFSDNDHNNQPAIETKWWRKNKTKNKITVRSFSMHFQTDFFRFLFVGKNVFVLDTS